MQESIQKSLNDTGGSCVIEIADLEKYFAEPFRYDPQSYRHRITLCGGFRRWLSDVKSYGVSLDVWIDGAFATYEALPKCVELGCVVRSYQGVRDVAELSKFRFLVQGNVGGWKVKSEYGCLVKLKLLNYKFLGKYDGSWFEGLEHYNVEGQRSGIFVISL